MKNATKFLETVSEELAGNKELYDAVNQYVMGFYSKEGLSDRIEYLLQLATERVLHQVTQEGDRDIFGV